jgi:hypothetical protein
VFLQRSTLYDANIALAPEQWYNVSRESGEVSWASGSPVPYGFFHEPMPTYENGYPVFISTQVGTGTFSSFYLTV